MAMKELVVQGWKSDNEFQAGYLNKLEKSFKKKISGTDLKGNPHMHSKLSIWKKDYNSLCTILSQSGVGFNANDNHMVDCDYSLWDNIIKIGPNANRIHKKSWLMYKDWKEIFRKDRANGEGAFGVFEAINQLEQEYASVDEGYIPGDYRVDLEDIISGDGTAANSLYEAEQRTVHSIPSSSKGKGRKRKVVDRIDKVCALIERMCQNVNS